MNCLDRKKAKALEEQEIVEQNIRVTVISPKRIRIEKKSGDKFIDSPTQKVICRNLGPCFFDHQIEDGTLYLQTEEIRLRINRSGLSRKVHFVSDEDSQKWIDPSSVNLIGGTYRTLDNCLGNRILLNNRSGGKTFSKVKLQDSLFSKEGVVVRDDSSSALLNEDGSISLRDEGYYDIYLLAFKDDYLDGLYQFDSLTGFAPVLPKYTLGNWWSRYYAYYQDEYLSLRDKFKDKKMPFTVATIDRDWHIVKNVPKDVKTDRKFLPVGWTGYTFEKKYFPDYQTFFKELKKRNLAITRNLHPSSGIRYYEKQYPERAKANGIDPNTKQPVPFDFTSLTYINSYFDLVLHPYEKEGVDFWWIDWQQGNKSKLKGVDPLWLLNHYHTRDIQKEKKGGITLSRYSGPGSQRYPLGFSGDTVVSFKSLRYQVAFTIDSVDAGYCQWSHDIGGHRLSRGNPEIFIRWLEFGVFSQINRLHSSKDKWSKEPWLYGEEAEKIATDYLQLRQRLLPYLYSYNVLTNKKGIPLIIPLYYLCKEKEAIPYYESEYYFGKERIVIPVTEKSKKGKDNCSFYLPSGRYYDFFTGEKIEGGKSYSDEVSLDKIPVYVREGSIIPMLKDGSSNDQNYTELEIKIYKGDGSFTVYDEENGKIILTSRLNQDGKEDVHLNIQNKGRTKKIYLTFIDSKAGEITKEGDETEILF